MSLVLDELAWDERLIRTYFRAIETILDQTLLNYTLVKSADKYRERNAEYPFVKASELRPGGVGPLEENPLHNTCLVLFYEHEFPEELKPNVRSRKGNRLLAENLRKFLVDLPEAFDRVTSMREIEDLAVQQALEPLMGLDFGILIQRRPQKKRGMGYEISHFHVKVDEVLDRVVERFGLELRYLSKTLFELGEEYAESLESKLYECYGMKPTASGRRTAGIIAHRLLQEMPGRAIVYVASQEARSLFKWTWKDTNRYLLIPFTKEDINALCESTGVGRKLLEEYFLYPSLGKDSEAFGIFQVTYERTTQGMAPKDRKLRREINPAERWVTVVRELILPKPGVVQARPIRYAWIYRSGTVELVEPIVDLEAAAAAAKAAAAAAAAE